MPRSRTRRARCSCAATARPSAGCARMPASAASASDPRAVLYARVSGHSTPRATCRWACHERPRAADPAQALARAARARAGAGRSPAAARDPAALCSRSACSRSRRCGSGPTPGSTSSRGATSSQHGLPHSDRLMALTAGRPWQDQQWLSHVTSYGLYRPGRPAAAVAGQTSAAVLAALCIAILASRSFGGSPLWITAAAGPLLLIQVPSEARAQSFVLPLFAALDLAARPRRQEARPADPAAIPMLALWANLHGSILIACMLVLLRCAVGARLGAAPTQAARAAAPPRRSRAPRCSRRSRRPTARICSATTARR